MVTINHKEECQPKKELEPVAIRVKGKLKDAIIEDNVSVGMRLLEADEIEGGSIARNKTFSSYNKPDSRSKNIRTFVIIVVATIIGTVVAPFLYNIISISQPSLEYFVQKKNEGFLFAVKNNGRVGIKNLSVTLFSKAYIISDGFTSFPSTGFTRKSEFDQPGENWLTSDYLAPKSSIEKEFYPSVAGDVGDDQYISVEVMNIYFQRENDLKPYQDRVLFISQNGKIYTESKARFISKYSEILDKVSVEYAENPVFTNLRGVQKLK